VLLPHWNYVNSALLARLGDFDFLDATSHQPFTSLQFDEQSDLQVNIELDIPSDGGDGGSRGGDSNDNGNDNGNGNGNGNGNNNNKFRRQSHFLGISTDDIIATGEHGGENPNSSSDPSNVSFSTPSSPRARSTSSTDSYDRDNVSVNDSGDFILDWPWGTGSAGSTGMRGGVRSAEEQSR
jgi:hypothetical protein